MSTRKLQYKQVGVYLSQNLAIKSGSQAGARVAPPRAVPRRPAPPRAASRST